MTEKNVYDVAAFGEILIDFTAQTPNDQRQMLFARNPGGAPANVAVAAQRLGAKTAFLGKAGQDMQGVFLRSVLEQEQVDVSGMILDDRYFTTLAFVEVNEAGERTFSFARKPGADTQITPEELNLGVLEYTKILHIGSLSLTDQPIRDTTFYAVKYAKKHGILISYDPNYRATLWPDEQTAMRHMCSLVPFADLMKLSDEETELLTGCKSVERAAQMLHQQGVAVVAVTLGDAGAYLYSKDGGRKIPGFKAQPIGDTNGAGDAFWGAFLYKISTSGKLLPELTGEELAEYARFGNAAASLCVEGKGAIPSMPTLEQVQKRLQNNG